MASSGQTPSTTPSIQQPTNSQEMESWIQEIESEEQPLITRQRSNRNNQTTANLISSRSKIFRVPLEYVREGPREDPPLFSPSKISFGPYHHDNPSFLLQESIKKQCLRRFLNRTKTKLEYFQKVLEPKLQELREMYDSSGSVYLENDKKDAFLQMMLTDGSCLLEIMLENGGCDCDSNSDKECKCKHHSSKHIFCVTPLFGQQDEMDTLRHDMLLLENQIPFKVLEALYRVPSKNDAYKSLKQLILEFFSLPKDSTSESSESLHILDVYRDGLLNKGIELWISEGMHQVCCDEVLCSQSDISMVMNILVPVISALFIKKSSTSVPCRFETPSAKELKDAQIYIKPNKTKRLMDISFKNPTLMLPQIDVDRTTKSTFHNLVLFERFYPVKSKDFSSYVYFMNSLLKDVSDVRVLQSWQIIMTMLQNDQVAKLFGGLHKYIVSPPDKTMDYRLLEVGQRLRERHNKNLKPWRKDLLQNLRTPCTVTAVIGAILIFIFTAVQTFYTAFSYYARK